MLCRLELLQGTRCQSACGVPASHWLLQVHFLPWCPLHFAPLGKQTPVLNSTVSPKGDRCLQGCLQAVFASHTVFPFGCQALVSSPSCFFLWLQQSCVQPVSGGGPWRPCSSALAGSAIGIIFRCWEMGGKVSPFHHAAGAMWQDFLVWGVAAVCPTQHFSLGVLSTPTFFRVVNPPPASCNGRPV